MTRPLAVLSGARGRLRRGRRRAARVARARAADGLVLVKRHAPISSNMRARLYASVPWRPGRRDLPIGSLLLGTQNRMSAQEFATASGQLMWPSTRVLDGPHAELLTLSRLSEDGLDDAQILASSYGELARTCLRLSGQYFWARDDRGVVEVARDFIARVAEPAVAPAPRDHQSEVDSPIRVAPIRGSDCFQVIDGHHRIAIAAARGQSSVPAAVRWTSVETPLQSMLDEMSWIGGERELYQPVDAPELRRSWATVRGCLDRRDKMLGLVGELGLDPASSSYLDVASCYGWFVAEMGRAGLDARGIERDPLARPLGHALYGVNPEHIEIGDAVDILGASSRTHDVVSCFSLLHHFALGRASIGPEDLVRLLDRATGRVLFLDTGQAHEAWFAESLREWDTAYVERFLREHGTFERVIDLGPDDDARPPYQDNYARHLFACIR